MQGPQILFLHQHIIDDEIDMYPKKDCQPCFKTENCPPTTNHDVRNPLVSDNFLNVYRYTHRFVWFPCLEIRKPDDNSKLPKSWIMVLAYLVTRCSECNFFIGQEKSSN